MDTINYFIRIKKEDVYVICPYLESFEGMAAIRNPAPAEGPYSILKLMVSPSFEESYNKIIDNLGKKVWLERITEHP
ncbi:MAG: hypothetical protein WCV91_02820 [Candidatus Margulisiibacteriota bacterium]